MVGEEDDDNTEGSVKKKNGHLLTKWMMKMYVNNCHRIYVVELNSIKQ